MQGLFIIMSLLLKYHVPSLSNFLQENDIPPELYATSWFLTMFATKLSSVNLTYILWEQIIRENDVIFPCFIGVALLEKYKNKIIGKEFACIPGALNKISIHNERDLQEIINRSKELKQYLPISTSTKLKNYDIFNLQNIDSYTQALSKSACLSILPREVLHLTYPEVKICSCVNTCTLCRNSYPIIIVDCRTQEHQNQGYFPNTEFFIPEFDNPNSIQEFPSRFEGMKGIFHFALMGNEDIKNDNISEESDSLINQLLKAFLDKEFPLVSIVEGGYKACHEFALHYKLKIKGHRPSNCYLCTAETRVVSKKRYEDECREKIRITNTMQIFDCRIYDRKLKGNLPEIFLFVISFENLFIVDNEKNIFEKFNLTDLVKITKVSDLNKTLIFYFSRLQEKKSYTFLNKKKVHAESLISFPVTKKWNFK